MHLEEGNEVQKAIWVFGYGSLIHTPNFQYDQRVVGCIKGYRRVFWQGSTDHRGTPERPGRTVTLVEDDHPAAATWGVAFQLAGSPEQQAAALSYLEWREKQYDVRHLVDVYGADGEVAVRGALVYIASPANGNYLGPADPWVIAAQIATCKGPSGPNFEYLFKLADAMRGMGVPDPDLFALEEMVRQEMTRLWALEPVVAAAHGGGCGVLASDAEAPEACGNEGFRRWHAMGGQAHHIREQPQQQEAPGVVAGGQGPEPSPLGLHGDKGAANSLGGTSRHAHAVYAVDAVSGSAYAASEPG